MATLTITVGAQSFEVSTAAPNQEVADILRDAASYFATAEERATLDLQDPATIAGLLLRRTIREWRDAAKTERDSVAADAARAAVPPVSGEDWQ